MRVVWLLLASMVLTGCSAGRPDPQPTILILECEGVRTSIGGSATEPTPATMTYRVNLPTETIEVWNPGEARWMSREQNNWTADRAAIAVGNISHERGLSVAYSLRFDRQTGTVIERFETSVLDVASGWRFRGTCKPVDQVNTDVKF